MPDALSTNPEAKIEFIAANGSLLKELSRICQKSKRKENEVLGLGKGFANLLVVSQGSAELGGRSCKLKAISH